MMQSGIKVKLPQTKTVDIEADKTVSITISADGKVYLDSKLIEIDELKSRIKSRISQDPDIPVLVKADKEVKYDYVVKVLDAAKQAGAKKFALATEVKNPS